MASQLQELIERWFAEAPVRAAGPDRLELIIDDATLSIGVQEVSEGVAELAVMWQAPAWLVSGESEAMPALPELAQATAQSRSGLLRCQAATGGIEVRMTVYLEGISRQSFTAAVAEVGRAYRSLERTVADFEGQRESLAEAEKVLAEAQAAAARSEQQLQSAQAEPAPVAPASDTCVNCGAEMPSGMRFCSACGTAAPQPGEAPHPPSGVCSACGTANPPEFKFCSKCGKGLS